MKIDKLGFYRRADGEEVEIVHICKPDEYNFIAIAKTFYSGIKCFSLQTYTDDDGTHEDYGNYDLIEFLRPSGVEWPTPRKTSFVAYFNEDALDDFDITDPECIRSTIMTEIGAKKIKDHGIKEKISKWRFYGEELLGD